jgi:multidrug resistance protein MdtO
LQQAAASTSIILSMVEFMTRPPQPLLPQSVRQRMAALLDEMAGILRNGGYPVDIVVESGAGESHLTPVQARAFEELKDALTNFAHPPSGTDMSLPPAKPSGFFHADAFSNPVHVQYALKTTTAAMLCYFVYSMLDWPGIHTCLITCYIVSLDSTAETFEKQTLRFFGCMFGAAIGLLVIVFVMPGVQSIGALMALIFVAAALSGWVAAGSARISYVGFQIAFAFFLSVVQGASPAFDMSIARDRLIGILLGNLAVALIFTTVRPVSLAARIDSSIAELLRRLSILATTASLSARWALASEAQKMLGMIEQNLELLRYEPVTIRPAPIWLSRRRQIVRSIGAMQAPLLIEADQNRAVIGERLARLSLDFEGGEREVDNVGGTIDPASTEDNVDDNANGSVDAGLAVLESIAANKREA